MENENENHVEVREITSIVDYSSEESSNALSESAEDVPCSVSGLLGSALVRIIEEVLPITISPSNSEDAECCSICQ